MDEQQLRIDLACALRWTARVDLHEGVANHFSAAVDGGRFLMNPRGRHFSQICTGDLVWEDYDNRAHFAELRCMLDAEPPQYRN